MIMFLGAPTHTQLLTGQLSTQAADKRISQNFNTHIVVVLMEKCVQNMVADITSNIKKSLMCPFIVFLIHSQPFKYKNFHIKNK